MQIGVEGSYVFEAYFRIAPVLIDGVYYYLDTEWQNATVARSLEYSGDIVVPESVTYEGVEYWVNYIEDYAFYYRPITSLTIEPNICPNSEYTITGCDKLEVLKVGTCFLYNSNVYNVSSIFPNLRELHITSGYVEDLPEWWDLEVVDLSKAYNTELYANLFVNGDYMYAWDNLKRLVLPEGLDQIWPRQFEGLWLLEEIVIPENVTEIPDGAFYNCHALSSITLNKNLETIGNYAFYNCHALESLVLPEGVTEVGNAAFYGCAYLEELEMPATLKQVADNAFAFCSKVKIIKSKALEPPVLSEKTFYEVDRSIPVYVAEVSYDKYVNDQYWGEFFNIIPTSEYNE